MWPELEGKPWPDVWGLTFGKRVWFQAAACKAFKFFQIMLAAVWLTALKFQWIQ